VPEREVPKPWLVAISPAVAAATLPLPPARAASGAVLVGAGDIATCSGNADSKAWPAPTANDPVAVVNRPSWRAVRGAADELDRAPGVLAVGSVKSTRVVVEIPVRCRRRLRGKSGVPATLRGAPVMAVRPGRPDTRQ
jgi:hypothetical protein